MHSVENLHTVGENWNFLWTFNPLETEFLQTKRNPSLCSAEGRNNIPSGDSVFLNNYGNTNSYYFTKQLLFLNCGWNLHLL